MAHSAPIPRTMTPIALPGLVDPHDLSADRQFSMFRFKRYEPTRLREMLESLGWDQLASYPYGIEEKSAAQLLLYRKRNDP